MNTGSVRSRMPGWMEALPIERYPPFRAQTLHWICVTVRDARRHAQAGLPYEDF